MPILETERLLLRPPIPADVPAMATWLGDYDVARNMSRVPYPYGEQDAENFIAGLVRPGHCFAIVRRDSGMFLGGCGLHTNEKGVEFGYWLGKPFWGEGFATEAARRMVRFAFEELGLDSVFAGWFADNPASGHVLAKLGARHQGTSLRHSLARGRRVLCHEMLLTRETFLSKRAA